MTDEEEWEYCGRAVDPLMGRAGNPLLATGTRDMWSALVWAQRAAARDEGVRIGYLAARRELEKRHG